MNFEFKHQFIFLFIFALTVIAKTDSICAQEATSEASTTSDSGDVETAATDGEESAPSKSIGPGLMFSGYFWDLELEGGFGFVSRQDVDTPWMGRVRAGVLRIRDPWFASLCLGFDVGGLTGMGVGLHGVLSHYGTGLWAQGIFNVSFEAEAIFGLAVGWSVLGLEMQVDPEGDSSNVLALLRIRIPIGILVYGKTKM